MRSRLILQRQTDQWQLNPLVHSVLLKGHYKTLDVKKNAIQYSNEKCLIAVTRGP